MENILELIKKAPIVFWMELLLFNNRQTFYNNLENFKNGIYEGERKKRFELLKHLVSEIGLDNFSIEKMADKIKTEIENYGNLFDVRENLQAEVTWNFNRLLAIKNSSEYVMVRNAFDHFAGDILRSFLLANSISPELINAPEFKRRFFDLNIIPRKLFILGGPGANVFANIYQYHPHQDFSENNKIIREISTANNGRIWLIYNNTMFEQTDETAAIIRFLDLVHENKINLFNN